MVTLDGKEPSEDTFSFTVESIDKDFVFELRLFNIFTKKRL